MIQSRSALSEEYLYEFTGSILQKHKHYTHWQLEAVSLPAVPPALSQLPDLFSPTFCLRVHRPKFSKLYHQKEIPNVLASRLARIQVTFNRCFPIKKFTYKSERSNSMWYQRQEPHTALLPHACHNPETTYRAISAPASSSAPRYTCTYFERYQEQF